MSAAPPRRAVALGTVLSHDTFKRSAHRVLEYLLPERVRQPKEYRKKATACCATGAALRSRISKARCARRWGWRCLTYRRKRIESVPDPNASRRAWPRQNVQSPALWGRCPSWGGTCLASRVPSDRQTESRHAGLEGACPGPPRSAGHRGRVPPRWRRSQECISISTPRSR
jgi:hypothetical protein